MKLTKSLGGGVIHISPPTISMNKISQTLKNTDRVQHKWGFVKWPSGVSSDSTPEAYCALGALYCEAGLVQSYGNHHWDIIAMLTYFGLETGDKREAWITTKQPCPAHDEPMMSEDDEVSSCNQHPVSPNWLIPHLNDEHGWTFKQIGEWLETIGF